MIIVSTQIVLKTFFCFSAIFYMCNCDWYTYIYVYTLFNKYTCYNCYVIQRRRLHKFVKLVFNPFCLFEQMQLL